MGLWLSGWENIHERADSIIGWPVNSPVGFYKKYVCAVMIDEKFPGVYKRMIDIDEQVFVISECLLKLKTNILKIPGGT